MKKNEPCYQQNSLIEELQQPRLLPVTLPPRICDTPVAMQVQTLILLAVHILLLEQSLLYRKKSYIL